jgi:Bardet-Biedl syndrome 9 protein
MSLFKVCQWWSTQCSDISKSYDSYSLNCCRLHFDNMEKDCIVITSHNGYMGIYRPTSERLENGQITGFQHSDVVLEINFQQPVIGFCSGRFSQWATVSGIFDSIFIVIFYFLTFSSNKDPKPLLAVLHPMKLMVYALVTSDGIADHGN